MSALIGSTMMALLLTGCSQHSAGYTLPKLQLRDAGALALNRAGRREVAIGRWDAARLFFLQAAALADHAGEPRASAINRSNAGSCEVVNMQFGAALLHFQEARRIAEKSGEMYPLIFALNNLSDLYIVTAQPENAFRVARQALDGPAGHADEEMRAQLLHKIARSLFQLRRFDEASQYHHQAVDRLTELNQLPEVARSLGTWGNDNLREGRIEEAELALNEALLLIRTHRLNLSAYTLTGLGKLSGIRRQNKQAATLFNAALAVTDDRTPRWRILSERGQFRLSNNDSEGAYADFRDASRIASRVRADMVPADQDRVAFENGIGQYLRGLVEAGNRLATKTGRTEITEQTFDAAEQTRLWSLRALLPAGDDWRSRLDSSYWEKLSRYQGIERKALANLGGVSTEAEALKLELQQMEAAAAGTPANRQGDSSSPLRHARSLLDSNTVLFSFHIAPEGSWLWAVDRGGIAVFPLPPVSELAKLAGDLTKNGPSPAAGAALYSALFGRVPSNLLNRSRWLLELDGPLHDVPFAALVSGISKGMPQFLVERAMLQIIPSALLLQKRPFNLAGGFVGIGDPVYNAADARFRGQKGKLEFSLPRLPGTSAEVQACARAWNGTQDRLLTGPEAALSDLNRASQTGPAVLHFATHVVAGSGNYRSGLIALSVNSAGAMDLLGPREILARPTGADLVVMNGCHSGQGETVPSSGRMGLTRAWIGAGAASVLATHWDVPDDDSQSLMVTFYRALRENPAAGPAGALREAQLAAIRANRMNPARWAGHYLVSRAL